MLSKAARNLLAKLAEEDAELDWFSPGGWWIDDHQTSGKLGFELLRLCLIREEQFSRDDHKIYTINEEGRKALADPNYIPEIVQHLKAALR